MNTVLLDEDEPHIRRFVSLTLEGDGCRVLRLRLARVGGREGRTGAGDDGIEDWHLAVRGPFGYGWFGFSSPWTAPRPR